jgi:hypothetical protein
MRPADLWAMDEEELQLWLDQAKWWNEEMEKKRKRNH